METKEHDLDPDLPEDLAKRGGVHFAVFVRLKRGRVQWALKIEIEA